MKPRSQIQREPLRHPPRILYEPLRIRREVHRKRPPRRLIVLIKHPQRRIRIRIVRIQRIVHIPPKVERPVKRARRRLVLRPQPVKVISHLQCMRRKRLAQIVRYGNNLMRRPQRRSSVEVHLRRIRHASETRIRHDSQRIIGCAQLAQFEPNCVPLNRLQIRIGNHVVQRPRRVRPVKLIDQCRRKDLLMPAQIQLALVLRTLPHYVIVPRPRRNANLSVIDIIPPRIAEREQIRGVVVPIGLKRIRPLRHPRQILEDVVKVSARYRTVRKIRRRQHLQ